MDAAPLSSTVSKIRVDQPGAQDAKWVKQGDFGGWHGCAGHWGLLYTDHDSGRHGVSTITTCPGIGQLTAKPSLVFSGSFASCFLFSKPPP